MKKHFITTGYHIPYNPELKEKASYLRKNMTAAERKLWFSFLKGKSQRFLRQKPLNNYIVDFYCAQNKLVIEIDGDSHYTEEAKIYDQKRTNVLDGYGLTVLRFTNPDVLNNFAGVCEEIERYLSV